VAPPTRPSSTKKAAKATQRTSTTSVRFQGGRVFPLIVALIVVLGLGTVVYARQSIPAVSANVPTLDDNWNSVYGFYICDDWYSLTPGDLEVADDGSVSFASALQPGISSPSDALVNWQTLLGADEGRRATLELFLEANGVEFDETGLIFSEAVGGLDVSEFIPSETTCDGQDAELSVVVWQSAEDTGRGNRYIANFGNIRFQNDGMVFAVAFVPRGESVPLPPWAAEASSFAAGETLDLSELIDGEMEIEIGSEDGSDD